jgi:RNA polymerase sigma factor (sigma-70 family)
VRPPLHELQALADRELVARARRARHAGDAEVAGRALAIVWLRNEELVRTVIARKVARAELDDVSSEACERFLRAVWSMAAEIENPAALLLAVARRTIADHYERAGRRPAGVAFGGQDVPVDGGIAEAEAELAFRELLAPLSARQREVVELRVRQGLSSAETGRRVGITANNVDQILFRALERLRAEAR